jgi:hypothetical protein
MCSTVKYRIYIVVKNKTGYVYVVLHAADIHPVMKTTYLYSTCVHLLVYYTH